MLLNPLGVDNHPYLPPDPKRILESVKAFFSVQKKAEDTVFICKKIGTLSDKSPKKQYLQSMDYHMFERTLRMCPEDRSKEYMYKTRAVSKQF